MQTEGFYANAGGWAAPTAAASVYSGNSTQPIRITADRIGAPPGVNGANLTVRVGPLIVNDSGAPTIGTPVTTHVVPAATNGAATVEIVPPPMPYRIEFQFDSSFKQSDFGAVDTRDLGGRIVLTIGDLQAP